MNIHLTYNETVSAGEVVGLLYLFDPAAQLPSTRVLGAQVGRLRVPSAHWTAFREAWLAAGHTASWGFN